MWCKVYMGYGDGLHIISIFKYVIFVSNTIIQANI